MSGPAELNLSPPTSAVRNTVGKGNEQISKNLKRTASDAALREYSDKHYHQLLPIIAEKVHQQKMQQEKLKEVKARLNFDGCSRRNSKVQEVSHHSESRTPNVRGEHRRGRRPGRSRSVSGSPKRTSVFSRIRHDRSESPRHKPGGKGRRDRGVFNRWEIKERVYPHTQKAVTRVTAREERNPFPENVTMKEHVHGGQKCSPKVKIAEGDTGSQNQKSKGQVSRMTTYHNHVQLQRWNIGQCRHGATCSILHSLDSLGYGLTTHLQNPNSYDDLKKAFLANFLQQKKCIKDPVEIHHIKQREGESTEYFVQRFKAESRHVKGAPECMRISEFMHGITNPELIKRLHDNIPKSVDEMMRVTTTFLMGEVAASNQAEENTSGMEATGSREKTKF
ncbi:reverse transcriptase domain-containing protein [Tanacetum coccineum]|uniref:Reverse transcriptase domain-containing protein n=1 Tax=Tanacetum coccineum TaxID=301880 RepID=A0ABQ5AS37_9ASTR